MRAIIARTAPWSQFHDFARFVGNLLLPDYGKAARHPDKIEGSAEPRLRVGLREGPQSFTALKIRSSGYSRARFSLARREELYLHTSAWEERSEGFPQTFLIPLHEFLLQNLAGRLQLMASLTLRLARAVRAGRSGAIVKARVFRLVGVLAPRPAGRGAGHQRHSSFAAFAHLRFYRSNRRAPEPPPDVAEWLAPV